MEMFPKELILDLSKYLNPAERYRLSCTSRCYRELFPSPLRIRISSKNSRSSLKSQFYVSKVKSPSRMLSVNDELIFGEEYLFWTYDFERENKVLLNRHGQKLLHSNGQPNYIFTLGLRPRNPNQYWRIKGGEDGETVPFESIVKLDVGGESLIRHRPDSHDRMFLSSHAITTGAFWYSIQQKSGLDEQFILTRCREYSPSDDIVEKDLIIHAIPDIIDGGYSMYSPKSLKDGRAACDLFYANIQFHYWIQAGTIFFHAFNSLKFSFGIPILEEDNVDSISPISPLKVLLKKNSSRWWATRHYMSTAADISCGRDFDLENFMRTVKDHEDHSIIFDKSRNLVYIEVQDAVVNKSFPDFLQNKSEVWEFLLCG